jgi:hypothetical protein
MTAKCLLVLILTQIISNGFWFWSNHPYILEDGNKVVNPIVSISIIAGITLLIFSIVYIIDHWGQVLGAKHPA